MFLCDTRFVSLVRSRNFILKPTRSHLSVGHTILTGLKSLSLSFPPLSVVLGLMFVEDFSTFLKSKIQVDLR